MGGDLSPLAKGLAGRFADLTAAMARLDRFAFRPEGDVAPPDADVDGAARELVVRALHVASDPVNDRILTELAEGDASLVRLAEACGITRLAVWERVNDLVQVGLVARELEGDRVGLTPAGQTLGGLLTQIAASVAAEVPR